MLIRFRFLVLAIVLSLLAGCVSVSDKVHLVSNANASTMSADIAGTDLQTCEVKTSMDSNTNNTQGLDPESIDFLNWNIYKGNGENWQQDLSDFAKDHDLMTIQEAVLNDELTGLLEVHDFNWVMNTAFHFNGDASGVMTVSGFDAVHSCGFHVKEPLIRIPKSTLISYYAINGSDEKLLVANIHGINFTLGLSAYRKQLEKLYDAIEHHDGPMIVAGDFNSWSNDRVVEVNQLVNRLSLLELEYPINNKTHVFGHAIDHVFYRQLDLVSDRVWRVSSSDHNPISVRFRFNTAIQVI